MKTFKMGMIIGVFLLTACGSDSDRTPSTPECQCTSSPVSVKNGLVLTFENQSVKLPSNVSVLFKVTTEEGVPLPNLTATDFKLYEDEAFISAYESLQAIRPKPGLFKSHILLLMDLSGSILRSDSLTALKEAAKTFVNTVMPSSDASNYGEMDMSVWWFDGSASIFPLVQSFVIQSDTLIAGIEAITENISKDSSTNLYGAVIEGVNKVRGVTSSTQTGVNVSALAIFTDGTDQASRRTKDEALNAVKNAGQGVSIYTIGLGGEIDETILKSLGKNGFVFASNLNDLTPKFEELGGKIKDDVRSHYLLEYCSPKRKGSHNLKISVTYHELSGSLTTCFCANGFQGGCKIE